MFGKKLKILEDSMSEALAVLLKKLSVLEKKITDTNSELSIPNLNIAVKNLRDENKQLREQMFDAQKKLEKIKNMIISNNGSIVYGDNGEVLDIKSTNQF